MKVPISIRMQEALMIIVCTLNLADVTSIDGEMCIYPKLIGFLYNLEINKCSGEACVNNC